MSRTIAGQYVPGGSLIHRLNSTVKMLVFLLLIVAIVCTNSIKDYAALTVFTAALVFLSGVGLKTAVYGIRGMGLFFLIIFVMNTLFFSGDEVLWSYGIIHVSIIGIVQGANVVLKIMYLMVINNVMMTTTAPMEITASLQRLMSPLKLIKIPADDLAMMISVAVQFIPTLMEETEAIIKAQTARGAGFEGKKLKDKAAGAMPLVIPIFVCAFRRADELALAMEARGYRSGNRRTKRKRAAIHKRDVSSVLAAAFLCIIIIFLL